MGGLQIQHVGIKASQSYLILIVLFFGITRFKPVESFPLDESFSSTSLGKNLETSELVGRLLQRRSTNDYRATSVDSNVVRFCASINSIRWAGHSWGVSNVKKHRLVKMIFGSPRTWFVWQVRISNRFFYIFGLKSMEQERFHFVRNYGNTKLILSRPQRQPTSNLQITDSRLFEVLSSTVVEVGSTFRNYPFNHLTTGLRHVATDTFIIDNNNNEILLERNKVDLVGNYQFSTKKCEH